MYAPEYEVKVNDRGYYYFSDKDHPLAMSNNVVYEHRHVASLKIGRWVTGAEVVHHIDGDKQNNDPDNLEIMTKEGHSQLHHALLGHTPSGRAKAARLDESTEFTCEICQEVFSSRRKGCRFCSNSCSMRYVHTVVDPTVRRKFDPSREELFELILELPFTKIGAHFGVSDNAVRKRAKALGLPTKLREIKELRKQGKG